MVLLWREPAMENVAMVTGPGSGVAVLSPAECWALLRDVEVGRLAVAVAGHPDIFPVNYLVDHATLVFRTAEGSKLAAVATSATVAFEVDGYDLAKGLAWSVVVKGQAREIKTLHDVVESVAFPLFPWQVGPKQRYVRIVPDEISGRRFSVVEAEAWRSPFSDLPRSSQE